MEDHSIGNYFAFPPLAVCIGVGHNLAGGNIDFGSATAAEYSDFFYISTKVIRICLSILKV